MFVITRYDGCKKTIKNTLQTIIFSVIYFLPMAVVVKLVNTLDCGSSIREFESRRSPHFFITKPSVEGFFYVILKNDDGEWNSKASCCKIIDG